MKNNKTIQTILFIAGITLALGFAGKSYYEDSVIDNMPIEIYELVVANLPEGASREDIVREYVENKSLYESGVCEMR